MKYTVRFGTFFDIPVRIHFTFPLILVAFGVEAWVRGGWADALWAVMLVGSVFVCVVLHEFGHSLQVKRYGITVRDIVLLPIGGMARAERIPERPREEIIVAISGPLVNFALALILFGVVWIRNAPLDIENDFLINLLSINIVLGTFNLIPAFPMDGGRILRGLLATRMPYLTATRYAKNVGQVIAILFAVAGFLDTRFIMLPLIAVFIFFGAMSEERMVRLKVTLGDRRAIDFMALHARMFFAEDTVEEVLKHEPLLRAFPVTDSAGSVVGAVDVADLKHALREGRGAEPLTRYIRTGFPLIDAAAPAIHTYHLLRTHKVPLAGIIEDNRYVGLVFREDLATAPV